MTLKQNWNCGLGEILCINADCLFFFCNIWNLYLQILVANFNSSLLNLVKVYYTIKPC